MTKQGISTGTSPNSGTGDTLLNAGVKINSNFDDIYTSLGDGSDLSTILINTTTPTGTASQKLQVNSGAYIKNFVGIGTTNPGYRLDVQDAINIRKDGSNFSNLYFNGTGTRIRYNDATGNLSFFTNSTERAYVGYGGAFYIISGGLNVSGGDISVSGADRSIINTDNNALILGTNNTEKVRITSSGSVGIGTTNPAKRLHVQTGYVSGAARGGSFTQTLFEGNNTASNYWEFQAPSTAANDILFSKSNVGGSSYGIVGYDHSVDALRFHTNGTECLRLDSNGFAKHTGSIGRGAPVTKTSNFSVGNAENWIICNGTASITVTLPTASAWTGREIMLKTIAAFTVVSASSNVVPLAGGAAGTAILTNVAGRWATLVSDGTNWIVMNAN